MHIFRAGSGSGLQVSEVQSQRFRFRSAEVQRFRGSAEVQGFKDAEVQRCGGGAKKVNRCRTVQRAKVQRCCRCRAAELQKFRRCSGGAEVEVQS